MPACELGRAQNACVECGGGSVCQHRRLRNILGQQHYSARQAEKRLKGIRGQQHQQHHPQLKHQKHQQHMQHKQHQSTSAPAT